MDKSLTIEYNGIKLYVDGWLKEGTEGDRDVAPTNPSFEVEDVFLENFSPIPVELLDMDKLDSIIYEQINNK